MSFIKNKLYVKKAINVVLAVIAAVAMLLITVLYREVLFVQKIVKNCAESVFYN